MMWKVCAILILTLAVSGTHSTKVTVCEDNTQDISCPNGQKLQITDAFYGRVDKNLCKKPLEVIIFTPNCKNPNALAITKKECEGLQSCTLHAVGSAYGNPCLFHSEYLEVTYDCVASKPNEVQRARVCENKKQTIECPEGRKIKIVKANYGRLEGSQVCGGLVLDKDCRSSPSLAVVTYDCKGQQSCDLLATNSKFGGDPCPLTSKYLEVEYQCKKNVPKCK